MPIYLPEGDEPRAQDSLERSLQKIVSLLGKSGSPATCLCTVDDAVTNAITTLATYTHHSSGVPTTGFGGRLLVKLDSATIDDRDAAALDVVWLDATDASRTATLLLRTIRGGVDMFSNLARKTCQLAVPHYTNTEEPVSLIRLESDTGSNILEFGGWNSTQVNSVTQIDFYAGATNTTLGSSAKLVLRLLGAGQILAGTTATTLGFFHFVAPSTSTALSAFRVEGTFTDITATTVGNYSNITFSPTAASSQQMRGNYFLLNVTGTASKNLVVNNFINTVIADSGAVATVQNVSLAISLSQTAAVTNAFHIILNPPTFGSTGTINTVYGLNIQDLAVAGVTTAWGVYQVGANTNNYFGGQIRIGSTTNLGSGILQVTGGLTFNGAQTIQTTTGNLTLATAAGNGDIIISPNGTGRLRFGTHVATADTPTTGYIEIKDSVGTTRKIAVIT